MNTNKTVRPSRWVASIRLQLNPLVGFGFNEVAQLIPLLHRIGFTWLYLSPVAESEPNSNHGYDTRNAEKIDEQRGGKRGFERMLGVADEHGMKVIWDYTHHQNRGNTNPLWSGALADDGLTRETAFDIDPISGENRGFWQHRHLAGLKVENRLVFDYSLRLLKRYARKGVVAGIRIDAADMLTNTAEFARNLARTTGSLQNGRFLRLAETIVTPFHLPEEGFDGTVGMESGADLAQVFIDQDGQDALIGFWHEVSGSNLSFDQVQSLCSQVHARMTLDVEARRIHREFNLPELTLADVHHAISAFPSRTHIDARKGTVSGKDADKIRAAKLAPVLEAALLNPKVEHAQAIAHLEQAVVGVAGCGFGAAAFRYGANIGLNDAGNNPGHKAITVDELHRRHSFRAVNMPRTLNTRTTHDTLISGDFRDILKTLTFAAAEWREIVNQWFDWNASHKVSGAPSRKEEYYLYQVFLGAGMVPAERLNPFITKWLRESGENTGWLDNDYSDADGRFWHKRDEQYEANVRAFADALRNDKRFVKSLTDFRNKLRAMGTQLTLSQLLIMLTAPGMGDVFQGDVLWLYLLVDPDNRCAADWESVADSLSKFEAGELPTLQNVKLWVLWKTLHVRHRHVRAFTGKAYKPIDAGENVVAYSRGKNVQVYAPTKPGVSVPAVPAGWRNVLAELGEAKLELDGQPVHVSLALLERVDND